MHHIRPIILKADGNSRNGRGFSMKELERAGITAAEAKKLKLPFDKRRRTAHDQNVKIIKSHVKNMKIEIKSEQKKQRKREKS